MSLERNITSVAVVALAISAVFSQLATASTTITNTRAEIDQMATLWETTSLTISALTTAQYPQFTGDWQYLFPNSGTSADGDVHINMAVDAAGSGKNGNNGGTASPIVAELINATNTQLSHLSSVSGTRTISQGIFRFYTEHTGERHFELHPATQLSRWNGSAFVLDADYRANIVTVPDGATHANSTYTNLLNGSLTMSATIAADDIHVTLTYPSPSVNYVQYDGVALTGVTSDSVSSYFLFQPDIVPGATVRCRLVANTNTANVANAINPGQALTINALTRTDMAAVADQIAALQAGDTTTFPRPVELITLGLFNLGASASTLPATSVLTTQATLNGSINPNGTSTTASFQYGTTTNYGSTTTSQSVGGGTNAVALAQAISNLAGNTTYHYRAVATNSSGSSYGADQTFTTVLQPPPTVTTVSASNVLQTTATLNTLVNPNGYSTTVHFQYGKTTNYNGSTTNQSIGSGSGDVSVAAGITGLQQSTFYHFRAVATSSNGTTNGPDQTFTTTPRAPTAIASVATGISTNSATLNGTVNPGGLATTYSFQYGPTTSYGSSTPSQSVGSGTLDVAITTGLVDTLSPNTTYHYRIAAINSKGTVNSSDQPFTTLPSPPLAITTNATNVGFSSATLNGIANPSGVTGSIHFEYGTTTGYGANTASQIISASNSAVAVTQSLSGLLANTTYHFRVVATTTGGTSVGADQTFTTLSSAPPDVTTSAASSIGPAGAVLNATINANGSPTTEYFEYGTSTSYGATTELQQMGTASSPTSISAALSGLTAGVTYHFRVVGINSTGTSFGLDQSFTTTTTNAAPQLLFTYTFDDVTTASGTSSAGGTANNINFSNLTAVGVSANSSGAGRFSFSNQALGATNASDTFTGAINAAKYDEFTVTPAAGYRMNLTAITFTLQRSGTGIRQYSVRSSIDNFVSNLSASINPPNSNLTVVPSPQPNIFQVTDATTLANTGSTITLGAGFVDLSSPVTFRFYGYNAEGSFGTFSVDNVAISGSAILSGPTPTISINPATGMTTDAATLNVSVNPNNAQTTAYFLFGTSASYGSITGSQSIPIGSSDVALQQTIAGLLSYTTYHFKVIATNANGISTGPDQTFTTAVGDRDGDQMPDDYEVQQGLNPDFAEDASADGDGDGFTNLQEYFAGTSPLNRADFLRIVDIEADFDGLGVTFTTVVGKKYRLQASDDLGSGEWFIVADNIQAFGPSTTVTDETGLFQSQRFYRVVLIP